MKIIETLSYKNYIGGKWIEVKENIPVYNPENNNIIGYTGSLSEKEILESIDNTILNFKKACQLDLEDRITILKKWYQLVLKLREDIAAIITLEQGKVITDSFKEVDYGASYIDWFIQVASSMEDKSRDEKNKGIRLITKYEPIGPVAAITPWNFPFAMITRKIVPALLAGCSILLKPSELTPFTAFFSAKLLEVAGLPGGFLNVITGRPQVIGSAICNDERIRKISFTGSTRIGRFLYQNSANSLRRLSLELGGNAPFIIFEGVDLEKVAEDLIISKTRGNGQSCTSANRVFIQDKIYDKLLEIIVMKFSNIIITNCNDPASRLGPLINEAAIEKIKLLIEDAMTKGSRLLCDGDSKGNLFSPTLLADCKDNMDIFKTEIFGPLIACYKFSTIEEVVERANNTEYGLQAYIYTGDIRAGEKIASLLDFGMVAINTPVASNAKAPFIGRKASGFGVEGSLEGLKEYLNIKYINIPLP